MDDILIEVYRKMARRHRCSADEILHDPDLRAEFLSNSRASLGTDLRERDLLSRLSYLRKRCRLPRSRDILAA